jgi:hypothetical protein
MSQLKGTALGGQNGRHEAEQFEMPLAQTPKRDSVEGLLATDPIVQLINQAKAPLEEGLKPHGRDSLTALIDCDLMLVVANRVKAITELMELVNLLRFPILRNASGLLKKLGDM